MNFGEIYELKRQNFLAKANSCFNFLVSDFGYIKIGQEEDRQLNGTVIQDKIIFENYKVDRRIEVINAYHPVDYGFEIDFYRPSLSTLYGDREMVFYVLKEEQDLDQSYLETLAEKLRVQFSEQIEGTLWF